MTSIDPLSQIPQQEIPTFKVVLLGETAVGKSCLISRYVNNTFLSNFVPTMGGYFTSKEIFYKDKNWSQSEKNWSQILNIFPTPVSLLCRHRSGCIGVWIFVRLSTSFCTIHPDATGATRV